MSVDFKKFGYKLVGEIEVTETLTAEMVSRLLDAAFAGCGYWCDYVVVPNGGTIFVDGVVQDFATTGLYKSEWLALGGVLTLLVEGNKHALTLEMFTDAIQVYCNNERETLTSLFENHDSATADTILQLALFEEVVYG